jgi:3D (Asp-Asp-Asp) domain-containing protein
MELRRSIKGDDMEVQNLQFNLPRLATIALAAPLMIFSFGMEGVVKAGEQPNSQQSQKASSDKDTREQNWERSLRQTLADQVQYQLHDQSSVDCQVDNVQVPEEEDRVTHTFVATAYCIKNVTACGVMVRTGIVAADPSVLPLGSIVKIDAGKYSGVYRVLDTGPGVRGKRLDIYMPCRSEAINFGRRKIQLEVLRYGWENTDTSAVGE